MKKLFLPFLMSFVALGAYGQTENVMNNKTMKKLTHQQKIEKKTLKEDSIANIIDLLIKNRHFIIQPTIIRTGTGQAATASIESNVIAMDSNYITIRMEPNLQVTATKQVEVQYDINNKRWIGGILIGGKIIKYEVIKQKKSEKGYLINVNAITEQSHTFEIRINVTLEGKANAVISFQNINNLETSLIETVSGDLVYITFPIYYYGSLAPFDRIYNLKANSFY
ncbi:MAG: hypothetical protein IQL11_00920 [Bacteroidales bacterium]|nr:hypothetical protein [Bacteroidales bacterium]